MYNNEDPLVSIIITNYNYGEYLKYAIDSALNQSYGNIEVIVVDDGSTDNSWEIIANYDLKIIPVLKKNGGQASAFNEGYRVSKGDILCFLDSDDMFHINKVDVIVNYFNKLRTHEPCLYYDLLELINKDGQKLGYLKPKYAKQFDNYYDYACKYRYLPYEVSGTSGLSINRSLANILFPLPEKDILYFGGDIFLVYGALLFGSVKGINQALTYYRIHDNNKHRWVFIGDEAKYIGVLKDYGLRKAVDKYLNYKLAFYNKKPVISFFESFYAIPYYFKTNDFTNLIKLPFKMMSNYVDALILKKSLIAIYLSIKLIINNITQIKSLK
jgi:glycosyltransferase involved in cell wall biosynthesis